MVDKEEWRLLKGQEAYLTGKTLYYRQWTAPRKDWDHDHCEFCMEKFSDDVHMLQEGYTTADNTLWICPTCYNDFKDMFQWKCDSENKGHTVNKHLKTALIATAVFIVLISGFQVLSWMIQNETIPDIAPPQSISGLLTAIMFLPLLIAMFFFGKYFEAKKVYPLAQILKFVSISLLAFAVGQVILTLVGAYN